MFNSNVVEKMISICKRMASEALLGRITHGKTQKPNESLNSIHKLLSTTRGNDVGRFIIQMIYYPDDAISCCMYRKSEVLQQPIPSYNDYRGITCLILMLLKK